MCAEDEKEEKKTEIGRDEQLETLLQPIHKDTKSLWFTCVFVSSVGLLASINIFAYQFVGKTPENYWCQVDALSNTNWTQNETKQIAIPTYTKNGKEEYSQCDMYILHYEKISTMTFDEALQYVDGHQNETMECSHRYFEGDVISFVTKWDLVCDRRSLYATAQSAIQSGFIIDSLLLGYLTDSFGRRKIFLVCYALCVFCGIVLAGVPYLWLFILLRMCHSTFSLAAVNAGIVLCLEMCSVKRRSLIGPYFSLPWAFGMIVLPLLAYYVRTWYYLQLAMNLPFVFIFLFIWLSGVITESPRWLILNKKYDEAYEIIKKTADLQGHELPHKEIMIKEMDNITHKNVNVNEVPFCKSVLSSFKIMCSFFSRKDLRVRTLLVSFIWFASSMIYYGVGLGADTINTNEYFFMLFGGIVESIALLTLWPITAYFGRRLTLLSNFLITSVSILIVAGLQYSLDPSKLEWLRVVLYLAGKLTIAAAFQLIWVYTTELYPTNLRCLAAGGGSSIAKVGSFFSPYINDILGQKINWAPAATFGGFSLLSASVVIFLPETVEQYLLEDLPSPDVQNQEVANNSASI